MTKEIFLSYRRDDSAGTTGRIYDRLVTSFPNDDVFMDVDSAMHGLDFVALIDERIASSDLVAIIIGPNWLTATNHLGERRIDMPDDFVRVEVSAALKRDVPVIPVLVDGASMPSAQDLPPELEALSRRHAVELRNTRFADDASTLVKVISERLGANRKRLWRMTAVIAGILALAGVTLVGYQAGVVPARFDVSGMFKQGNGASFSRVQLPAHPPEMQKANEDAEEEAQNAQFRQRIQQLELEAQMRKLREEARREDEARREAARREDELRQNEAERKLVEEEQRAANDLASLPVCEQLWRQRNAVFKKFGYCFSTPKGQQIFGNDGCFRDMDSTWNAMGDENRQFIKRVQQQERVNACH